MKSQSASKVDRGDEEEAHQHSSSAERNTEALDDDFDGLNIEDWLAKHHNEQASEQQSHRGVTIEKTAPTKERRAAAPAEHGFAGRPVSHRDEDVNITAQSIEDGSSKRRETASAQRTHHGTRETRVEQGRPGDNDESVEGFEDNDIIMEASIHLVNNNDSNNDFYVAELATTTADDQTLLVEGVNAINPRFRRIIFAVGFVVLLSVVSVVAAKITTWISSSSAASSSSSLSGGGQKDAEGDIQNTTVASSVLASCPLPVGNSNWTIADSIVSTQHDGGIIGWFVSTENGKIYLGTMNRTDTNFTVFAPASQAQIFNGLASSSLVAKMVTPYWYGHITNAFEHYSVEGPALPIEDMYDGMVLMSLAGYPLVVRLDPLRLNDVELERSECSRFYKNGVLHVMVNYPNPMVPWIGKSTFDVLLETNKMRNGDLSDFIALIETSAEFKVQLQLQDGDTKAITLFAPTNNALLLAAVDDPALALVNPNVLQHLLLNHIVSGNFVKHRWWVIPTGTKVSNTELRLETQGGQVLNLTIRDDDVTMNDGDVTIIQWDIFSEQGVLHVIDKLLI